MMPFHVDSIEKRPWKNGGGVTRQLSIGPAGATIDAFDWRVTLADIEPGDFAFSHFPGVERKTVLSGHGMSMAAQGTPRERFAAVAPLVVLQIDGEEALDASLEPAAIQAFNVMVRRDAARSRVSVHREAAVLPAGSDVAVFLCLRGSATLACRGRSATLREGEAVEVQPGRDGCVLTCADTSAIVLSALIERTANRA
jgi:environmental stress-induced protein Ves